MKTIIAKKPSVARELARIVGATKREEGYFQGGGYAVTWAFGHLVQLAMPDGYGIRGFVRDSLPILPETFTLIPRQVRTEKGCKPDSGVAAQIKVIAGLFKESEQIIVATDAGREGELIFRYLYHYIGCTTPFVRLWISSLTDKAIREGLRNLEEGSKYDNLYLAAKARSESDWLVGINGTQALSIAAGRGTYSVGRVQTPTLAMVCERYYENSRFTPETFWGLHLTTDGWGAGETVKFSSAEKWKEKGVATELYNKVKAAGSATIIKVERKEKTEDTPLLYDLTSIQKDANTRHGFTAEQTLDIVQKLYEKKLVTYPRTDSRYLTDDMAPLVPELVSAIQQSFQIQPDAPAPVNAAQVVNSKKVTDHHAIIPTKTAAGYDISSLPSGEQAILTMLAVRLICAVGTPCRYAETIVEAECAGQKFRTKGKTVTDMGWRRYAGKSVEDAEKNAEVGELPELSEGMTLELAGVDLKEGKTSPPKRFTEDLLLSAMESASSDEFPAGVERKGIGTPATRAAIIEKLVQKGFIERRGDKKTKYLCSTDKGNALVTVVPEQIQSPSMTADWEEKLLKIEHGEYDSDAFMGEISSMVSGLVKTYEAVKGADVLMQPERKVIGSCPACGSDVCETAKGWFCRDRGCKFALWKENRFFQTLGKQMTEELAKQLVNQGKARLTHCYSKKSGRYYDTTVHVETGEDGAAAFKLEFGGKK